MSKKIKASRFHITRVALARIFGNLSIFCLPISERYCLDLGFDYVDGLAKRAMTIYAKGPEWRSSDDYKGE